MLIEEIQNLFLKNKMINVIVNIITMMLIACSVVLSDPWHDNVLMVCLLTSCFILSVSAVFSNFNQIMVELIRVANWVLVFLGGWKILVVLISGFSADFSVYVFLYLFLLIWLYIVTPLVNVIYLNQKWSSYKLIKKS